MEILVHEAGILTGLKLGNGRLDDVPHLAPTLEAMGANLIRRQQVGHLEVLLRRIGH